MSLLKHWQSSELTAPDITVLTGGFGEVPRQAPPILTPQPIESQVFRQDDQVLNR
jgi:hypothetical protein